MKINKRIIFLPVIILFLCACSAGVSKAQDKSCATDGDCLWTCGCGCINSSQDCSRSGSCSARSECVCFEDLCTDIAALNKKAEFENWSVDDCMAKLKTVRARNLCIMNLARTNNDCKMCLEMQARGKAGTSDSVLRADYFDLMVSCIKDVAVESKDITMCLNINDKLLDSALPFTYDAQTFERVGLNLVREMRKNCINTISGFENSVSICDDLSGQDKEDCYYAIALARSEAIICKEVGQQKNDCISAVAAELKNKAICEEIEDKDARSDCIKLAE